MSPRRQHGGFTLPELMIAGAIASFLMLVTWELLLQGAEIHAETEARARMNDQARQSFEILTHGGTASGGATGTDGTGQVRGVRTGEAVPAGLRTNGRLTLSGNGLQIDGDRSADQTITCIAANDPLPDCTGEGNVLTVRGWIAEDPTLQATTRSVAGRTVETGLGLADPLHVQRRQRRPGAESEDYRTIITRMTEGAN
ncbi:PilW family protein [Minwuia sp.]|uniref:PilW family protein n=1 Tax=Minwuia sp. TaxID=2493630 RepID=UPI003A8F9163